MYLAISILLNLLLLMLVCRQGRRIWQYRAELKTARRPVFYSAPTRPQRVSPVTMPIPDSMFRNPVVVDVLSALMNQGYSRKAAEAMVMYTKDEDRTDFDRLFRACLLTRC